MSAPVQLVFRGEVLAGFRLEDVQQAMSRLLNADEAKLKAVFSGRPTVLKRDLAPTEAQRYVARLAALGARVLVEPMPAPAAASEWPTIAPPPEEERRPPPPAAPPPPVIPAAKPVAPVAPVVPFAAAATAPAPLELAPTTTAAAADEVTCPNCGERQTRRLLCRNCTTNIEMALAAKAEEEALRRAERQAALEARRHPRGRSQGGSLAGAVSAWPIGFGFSGRVGRLSAATANLWLIAALLLLTTGFLQLPSVPRALLVGSGALAVFFFSMRLTVLRCHDCDRHGWWALFVLVPYVGSLASLLFALLPGNPEANDYGPPPRPGRWRWFALSAVVLVLCSVMLVRAGVRFAERYAAHQDEDAEEVIDLGGPTSIGGGSGSGAGGIQDAFGDYLRAPGPKAFAASSRQNFAWVGNAGSTEEAVRNAMAQCDAHRKPYTPDCRLMNVNGQSVTH